MALTAAEVGALTVKALRGELAARDVVTTGKKAELQERLLSLLLQAQSAIPATPPASAKPGKPSTPAKTPKPAKQADGKQKDGRREKRKSTATGKAPGTSVVHEDEGEAEGEFEALLAAAYSTMSARASQRLSPPGTAAEEAPEGEVNLSQAVADSEDEPLETEYVSVRFSLHSSLLLPLSLSFHG